MAIWVFFLLCELLCPVAMILFGRGFMTYPEEEAAESPVHTRCGKLWKKIGWIMVPVTVFVHLLLLGKAGMAVAVWSSVIMAFQVMILMLAVLPAKRALRTPAAE